MELVHIVDERELDLDAVHDVLARMLVRYYRDRTAG
jgi:hypothetical protein